MPDDRNVQPGVRVVTTQAVTRELMEMAGVNVRPHLETPKIGPLEVNRLGRFFVIATMVLGASDALMLSIIAREDKDGAVTFPGWEII